jgi:hypothetical protein
MVQLHPYQYLYFNRMSGGLQAAATQYETDYYAHSFKELGERLADRLWETERERYLDGNYRVTGCRILPYLLTEHLPANFLYVGQPLQYNVRTPTDFYAGYRRNRCIDQRSDLPELVAVERQGVALNIMRDVRQDQEGVGQ